MASLSNSHSSRRGSNFKLDPLPKQGLQEIPEYKTEGTIITDAMVLNATQIRDFKKISELVLTTLKIDFLNYGNSALEQLLRLRKLDLSFNKIAIIQNLNGLKMLTHLNLSYNPILELSELILPSLTHLKLDGCKISKIDNQFRVCKNLQVLSL